MGWLLLNLLSVLIFCLSARQFLRAATEGMHWERTAEYSQRALRVEKRYRVFAWGMMTFVWLYLCFVAFLHSFQNDL